MGQVTGASRSDRALVRVAAILGFRDDTARSGSSAALRFF